MKTEIMASFHWQDNLSLTAFTPRDFQVELLAAAIEQNIIICLGHNSSKEFIALKLILEKSYELRQNIDGTSKITLFLAKTSISSESMYNLLFHLTDLKVINIINNLPTRSSEWKDIIHNYQVIILSASECVHALEGNFLELQHVNLIVIDECHKLYTNSNIVQLFRYINETRTTPKLLGLAGPIHSAGCQTDQLEYHLHAIEESIKCKVETASDIVTVLR